MGGKWTKVDGGGSKSRKDKIQSAFEQWRKGGSKGIFASFGDDGIGGFDGGGNGEDSEPDKEDPPLPPVDPGTNPDSSRRDVWEDTVGFYFPKSGMKAGGLARKNSKKVGKTLKKGGLVRGAGCAQRGVKKPRYT